MALNKGLIVFFPSNARGGQGSPRCHLQKTQTRDIRKWKTQQQELEFRITVRPRRGGIHSREEQNEMFRCFRKINAKIDRYQWGAASQALCYVLSSAWPQLQGLPNAVTCVTCTQWLGNHRTFNSEFPYYNSRNLPIRLYKKSFSVCMPWEPR